MKKGQLKNGFKFNVDGDAINDMRFVDALADMEKDATKISAVVRMLFGEEQTEALYKHVENDKGRVPVDEVIDCVKEVLDSIGDEGKN